MPDSTAEIVETPVRDKLSGFSAMLNEIAKIKSDYLLFENIDRATEIIDNELRKLNKEQLQ